MIVYSRVSGSNRNLVGTIVIQTEWLDGCWLASCSLSWLLVSKSVQGLCNWLFLGQARRLRKSRRRWRERWQWTWTVLEFGYRRFRRNWNLSLNNLEKPRSAIQCTSVLFMPLPHRVRALSIDGRPSVCLSVCLMPNPKSRMEGCSKLKSGGKEVCDMWPPFRGQKVKDQGMQ